jgi:hypothetical protein
VEKEIQRGVGVERRSLNGVKRINLAQDGEKRTKIRFAVQWKNSLYQDNTSLRYQLNYNIRLMGMSSNLTQISKLIM